MDLPNYNERGPFAKAKVTLKNGDLWKKFHALDTEMIITKSGRRMFPSLTVQLSGLDPEAEYCVLLEMASVSRCRYKYTAGGGWRAAGVEDVQSPRLVYVHPESPAKGEYWMAQAVSFGRAKLTNAPAPPAGHLALASMHRYQPRVVVAEAGDVRAAAWAPAARFAFPETQFVAVTAYQNDNITRLKIDNNPFAKGFRENGQSKCKRKRRPSAAAAGDEGDCKRTAAPAANAGLDKRDDPCCDRRTPLIASEHDNSPLDTCNYYCSPTQYFYPILNSYYFPHVSQFFSYENRGWNEQSNIPFASQNLISHRAHNVKPKRITDFSVKSLLGYE